MRMTKTRRMRNFQWEDPVFFMTAGFVIKRIPVFAIKIK
jgi:hypothetical protein